MPAAIRFGDRLKRLCPVASVIYLVAVGSCSPRQQTSGAPQDPSAGAPSANDATSNQADHPRWRKVQPEKWAASLDGYRPIVGTAVEVYRGAAKDAFVRYIDAMHRRVHPIFSDSFLASLEDISATSPLNSPDLRTSIEIILDETGRVAGLGIIATSGVRMFDVAVLESISNASPFAQPPSEILSADRRVYLHWQLFRHPLYACSTYFVSPYLLARVAAPVHAASSPPLTLDQHD